MQPRRDAEALAGAEASAKTALDALNSFSSQRGASALNRMRAAADAHPQGMAGVVAEMKAGGAYEDLRKNLTALSTQNEVSPTPIKRPRAL